ncbi:MAG: hypothetical protein HOE90_16210, partial [Bacteriovoracaceae bacterium]|nr:hypothetical protein [Bacteriovoracaceae bacterium]
MFKAKFKFTPLYVCALVFVFTFVSGCNFSALKVKKDDEKKEYCKIFAGSPGCEAEVVPTSIPTGDAEILAASSYVRIEGSAGGAAEYTIHAMTTDDTLTLYAAAYNATNDFLGNVSVNWTIQNAMGAITAGPSSSTTFTANSVGVEIVDLSILAFNDSTGNITVSIGAQAMVKVNDAAGPGGVELNTNTLNADQT